MPLSSEILAFQEGVRFGLQIARLCINNNVNRGNNDIAVLRARIHLLRLRLRRRRERRSRQRTAARARSTQGAATATQSTAAAVPNAVASSDLSDVLAIPNADARASALGTSGIDTLARALE